MDLTALCLITATGGAYKVGYFLKIPKILLGTFSGKDYESSNGQYNFSFRQRGDLENFETRRRGLN
jgi:hypothetical protein